MASALYLALSTETILLFVAGLKAFKTQLRRAYVLLCVAFILFALAQVQVPLTTITSLEWWTTSGLVSLPYVLSCLFSYLSLRKFARLVGIDDALTKLRFVLPAVLAVVVVSALVVPVRLSVIMPTELAHRTFTGIVVWMLALDTLTTFNTWRIWRAMGETYSRAMRWLFVMFFGYTVVHIHFLALQFTGYDNWYGDNSLETVPLALAGVLLVKAGYEFWRVTAPTEVASSGSPLDVVVYMASLATNRHEINTILDTVRSVSANLAQDGTLKPQHERDLAKAYLDLETYLIEKESLREFTREGLRDTIAHRYPHAPDQNAAFWSRLTGPGAS
jgi:hypothetical protein